MVYNTRDDGSSPSPLWFDVGNEWYTTENRPTFHNGGLWFDVGNEWYTTRSKTRASFLKLWFDVGNEWYTTVKR